MAKKRTRAEILATDTAPGKVLVMGLLANAPIFLAFILLPLLAADTPGAPQRYLPLVLFGTPVAAILAFGFYRRASPTARGHRAARLGVILAFVALGLWALALSLILLRPTAPN